MLPCASGYCSKPESMPPKTDAILPVLRKGLVNVSSGPGVYLMRDAGGRVIYVGKAANLKKRLASYFSPRAGSNPKTAALLGKVADFETILTSGENDALILESNLIKKYRPRYNVILKDDKRYPSLRIDPREDYPNLVVVRKVKNDGALYFGPYASARSVRQAVRFIHKTFKLRKCNDKMFRRRTRPCLNFQMSLCLAPCCLNVDRDCYHDIVKEVVAFLRGRTPQLIEKVQRQMLAAAEKQAYEEAAGLRDKLFALKRTLEKQISVSNDFKDRDVIALAEDRQWTVLTLLKVRQGFLIGQSQFSMEQALGDEGAKLSSFIRQYYMTTERLPQEILLSHRPEDLKLLAEFISATVGKKVTFTIPRKADKRRLVEMALTNARHRLEKLRQGELARRELLTKLRARLRLDRLPRRIECFDNSHLGGRQMVAAMAVFVDGLPSKAEFRRYRLEIERPDDYQAMAMALERRFAKKEGRQKLPDLLMVDGGKGQLNVALRTIARLGLSGRFDLVAIAKAERPELEADKVYLAGRVDAVNFRRSDEQLLFLQQIRDRAHRLAIGYQRLRHRMQGLESALDGISGIGPKRKACLLGAFGGMENMRAATLEQISALPGFNEALAKRVLEVLKGQD